RVVSGRVEHFNNEIQITHPDHILTVEEAAELRVEPVYGLTAGVTPRVLRKAVAAALERAPALPEWLDPARGLERVAGRPEAGARARERGRSFARGTGAAAARL